MKKRIRKAALLLAAALSLPMSANALGWTFSNSNGGNGTLTGDIPTFVIQGSDLPGSTNYDPNYSRFSYLFPWPTPVDFYWSYTTTDTSPSRDPAGYFIDSSYHQLTNDNGPAQQSGFESLSVPQYSVFGWYVYSVGQIDGPGVFSISPTAPIPEPETYALMLAGLAVVGAAARRRKAK